MSQLRATLNSESNFRNLLAIATIVVTLALVWIALLTESLLLPSLAIVGVISLWVIVRRPDFGLYILLFITYLRLSDIAIEFYGAPSVAKFFVVGLLGIIFYRIYAFGDRPDGWRTTFLLLSLYGLVLIGSLIYARDLSLALEGIENYVKNCIIALAITLLLDRPERLRIAIWSILVAGFLMSAATVLQAVTQNYDSVYFGLAQFAAERNILGSEFGTRASGPVGDPNYFSQVLIILIPLALNRAWHEPNHRLRIFAMVIVVLVVLANVFTFSRGGFLAMIVVGAIMMWRNPPRPILLIVSLALLLIAIPFIPSQYAGRMATIFNVAPALLQDAPLQADGAVISRLSEMAAAGAVFIDNPIAGVGLENYALYYPEYSEQVGIAPTRRVRSAHNLYLEILAETGIIGFSAFGLIVITAFRGLNLAYRRFMLLGNEQYASIAFSVGVSIIGYLVAAFFLHLDYSRYWWLLIGIALSVPEISRRMMQEHVSESADRQPAS